MSRHVQIWGGGRLWGSGLEEEEGTDDERGNEGKAVDDMQRERERGGTEAAVFNKELGGRGGGGWREGWI